MPAILGGGNIKLWKEIDSDGYEDTMVVAAGPSLDQCLELVRHRQGKLIAVGTVFRKLMQMGIAPDLVVFIEGDPLVYEQMEGLEDVKVPLLLSPYAYWKIARNYKGEIYFAQVEDILEKTPFSGEKSEERFRIGGTVSFFAIEAALRLGARKIDLVGLDLAFPSEKSHAEGTPRSVLVSREGLFEVLGVDGGRVYTDNSFDLYRREIEGLIQWNPQAKYINHSPNGAKIAGTD